jgi:pSer/pThr/pTyr-binding forkhead associated (FHA) protein
MTLSEDDDVSRPTPEPTPSTATLRVIDASVSMTLYDGQSIVVGRVGAAGPLAAVFRPYPSVARIHATLTLRGQRVEVIDSSRHGTFVGDEKVHTDTRVFDLPVTLRLGSKCPVQLEITVPRGL